MQGFSRKKTNKYGRKTTYRLKISGFNNKIVDKKTGNVPNRECKRRSCINQFQDHIYPIARQCHVLKILLFSICCVRDQWNNCMRCGNLLFREWYFQKGL